MTAAPAFHRRAAERWGRNAESLCCWWLRLQAWRIIARRCRTPLGEVDIIASRGRTLAFVEVKARPDVRAAAEALSPRQQARLTRAARAFLARNPGLASRTLRFDLMLVAPWRWPRHIPDAFRPDAFRQG